MRPRRGDRLGDSSESDDVNDRMGYKRELRASRRLMNVTEWEVQQIMLDLHDGPVQYMYAALSQIDLARRALGGDGEAELVEVAERMERVRKLLEGGLHEIRGFLGAFRVPHNVDQEIVPLIEGLLVQHEATTDVRVDLRVDGEPSRTDLPVKIALYRVLQEALSNAYRHGGASEVIVRLAFHNRGGGRGSIRLRIDDNGTGFDVRRVVPEDSFGLQGMRDRVEMIGGTFRVESTAGRGARVHVEVPV